MRRRLAPASAAAASCRRSRGGRGAGCLLASVLVALVGVPSGAAAQPLDRLPPNVLDAPPPSARVEGALDEMRTVDLACRTTPPFDLRRRIVELAVQEWAFFGFPVLDRPRGRRLLAETPPGPDGLRFDPTTRRPPTPAAPEAARVAATIAGYWAVTPEGAGIVRTQAERWSRQGAGARWNAPWSAAFISWVMCEAGLGAPEHFTRAIAHWRYVDQAIRATDAGSTAAGYRAWEVGEAEVEPGDLLCAARRPRYTSLAARRRQMGEGASTHCDIVVEVDGEGGRILAIGGNVLRAVSLKVLPARRVPGGGVRAVSTPRAPLYVHLELHADPIGDRGLSRSRVLAAQAAALGEGPNRMVRVLEALGVEGEWRRRRGAP